MLVVAELQRPRELGAAAFSSSHLLPVGADPTDSPQIGYYYQCHSRLAHEEPGVRGVWNGGSGYSAKAPTSGSNGS